MKIYIPSKLLPISPLPPWINRALISKIRLRQCLYLKAKSSSSPSLSRSYCSLCNSISSSLKKSKASFFHSLSYSSPSKFWSFVKSLRRSSSSIPPLYSNGHCYQFDSDKANCLNSFLYPVLIRLLLLSTPFPHTLIFLALILSSALKVTLSLSFLTSLLKLPLVLMAFPLGC